MEQLVIKVNECLDKIDREEEEETWTETEYLEDEVTRVLEYKGNSEEEKNKKNT